MTINRPQKKNGMFILRRGDIDDIAEQYLSENAPEALCRAPVNIERLAADVLYLNIEYRTITRTGAVLGLTAFDDCTLGLYSAGAGLRQERLRAGTVLIEAGLARAENEARRRFTIAHEASHWLLHRSYFLPIASAYTLRRPYVSCGDIGNTERRIRSDNDWAEWQADCMAGALLMPRGMFERAALAVSRRLRLSRQALLRRADPDNENKLKRTLAQLFAVSRTAVDIRLGSLGLTGPGAAGSLHGVDIF